MLKIHLSLKTLKSYRLVLQILGFLLHRWWHFWKRFEPNTWKYYVLLSHFLFLFFISWMPKFASTTSGLLFLFHVTNKNLRVYGNRNFFLLLSFHFCWENFHVSFLKFLKVYDSVKYTKVQLGGKIWPELPAFDAYYIVAFWLFWETN